jgi:hypothetical protein
MAALMLAAILSAWLGVWGPLDLSSIKEWQTLVASLLAICGVGFTAFIAVQNVTRQIKINIYSREEDRIERMLPGLREAEYFASGILQHRVTQSFIGVVEAFRSDGFGIAHSTYQKDVEKALPNTDGATRRTVERRLYSCFRWAVHTEGAAQAIRQGAAQTSNPSEWEPSELEKKRADIDTHRENFGRYRVQFAHSMDALEAEILTIRRKIELYENRVARIRDELERYFGEGSQRL